MVDAVSNIPFSYYNVLNPTAAQPQPASDNSTATADSTAFDTAVGGSTSAPQATATATAGPQLPADVIALLQQYLSPSTSDPAAALLGTDTAGGNNDLLSALLSVNSYGDVLSAAYQSSQRGYAQSNTAISPSVTASYEAALNAYNNSPNTQDLQAAVGANASQPTGTTA